MPTQDYRVMLTNGKSVVIAGVTTTPTIIGTDITYNDGDNYRDSFLAVSGAVGGLANVAGAPVSDQVSTIPNGIGTDPGVPATFDTSVGTVILTSVSDEIGHYPQRFNAKKVTMYLFTLANAFVMHIPVGNVVAMYTDEAT